ncbi:MAG: ferrochelatase [Coriobacteriia bacterium]|nr:ferrochelatase [Coriobacteriia bacterium]
MVKTGVLITGFGGPNSIEAVAPFMCNLMGQEPSEELVTRVCARYLAIGGSSPLNEIAKGIARKMESSLQAGGHDVPVAVGMRYWDPYIGDALAGLRERGCERVITVSLSPFESKVAHGAYREAVDEAVASLGGMTVIEAPLVSTLDAFASFYAMSTAATLVEVENNEGLVLAFTAHSLPEGDLVQDDPYVGGLRAVADAVVEQLGLEPGVEDAGAPIFESFQAYGAAKAPRPWFLVYQSKGNRPGGWLGPDIDELIDAVAASGAHGLVVVPIGFLTDHMETLYDLDIVAAGRAYDSGLEFVRAPAPNDEDSVIDAVTASVLSLL